MKKKYSLPNMEFTFNVQVTGDETKIPWVGDFTYRRPNLKERAMIDVMWKKMNGDLSTLDADTYAYNEAIAYLRFTLKEFPDWWKEADYGGNLYDANVVLAIYAKALEFEQKWREKTFGGDAEKVEAGNVDQEVSGTANIQ